LSIPLLIYLLFCFKEINSPTEREIKASTAIILNIDFSVIARHEKKIRPMIENKIESSMNLLFLDPEETILLLGNNENAIKEMQIELIIEIKTKIFLILPDRLTSWNNIINRLINIIDENTIK